MPSEIKRIINFFSVRFTRRNNPVNLEQLFSHVNGLPYSEEGRFLQVGEENFQSIIIDSLTWPIKFRFGVLRTGALPLFEEAGHPPVPFEMPDNAGFYEPTHAVLFEEGIAGVEHNQFGPKLPRLHEYLTTKFPDRIDKVEVAPLMRPGLESEISRIGEVKMLKLKLNRDIVGLARDLDPNIFDALRSLEGIHDQIMDFEIVLRAKPRHSFDWDNIKRNIPSWTRNSEVQSGVETFRARAIDTEICKPMDFDFLQNYIRSDKKVVPLSPRSKCVNPESMYSKIIESYGDLLPSIRRIAIPR